MAGLRRYFCLQLLAFLLSNCLSEFGSNAQLIPQDEVDTLQLISNKMKNTYWKNVNQNSCNDGGDSFNQTITITTSFSSVICDCSFNQSSVCHVVNITMKGLSLSGVLPAEFGNLSYLRVIDLSRNYLSGAIPVSLTKIPLVTLGLLGNRITGPIPDEIGQIATLEYLGLEDNELNGTLPQSLGNLKLTNLVLSGNNFVGRIPESFSKLKNLTELRINGNNFSGKIPDFLGNWTKLSILELLGTSMEGPIPPSISLLTNLTILRISDLINTTSTVIPNLTGMTNLSQLVLRNCLLTGNIPGFIPNLSQLKQVDLSYNQLTGQVPDSMQNLGSLQYLFLTNNSLSGTLPNWILNSKHYFDVSYNNFSGSTPTSCQISSNVNLVSSYSSTKGNSVNWCLKKDLPCTNPQYDSLFINCGGQSMNFDDHEYEENSSNQGPSTFFAVQDKWAYSSTGAFLYNDNVNFVAQETSNPNITGIYQTARQAPTSLKYYGLCMLRGNYTVKLHFAEIMFSDDVAFSGDGKRIFDVAIQGKVVLKDFNIAARAGGAGKITVAEFNHIFVDGTLEIFLYWAGKGTTSIPTRSTYGPLISGISVTSEFKTGSGLSPGAIVGIVVASCVILVSILLILRKKGYLGGKVHENEEFQGLDTGYFTLRQIKAATDDFNHENKVGEGGFGPVYKGTLSDGRVIAVKQLSSKSKQGNREFLNEIGMISALQHPNLVKLYGCCIDKKELLLVYEYMENNSLARALFGEKDQQLHLDWQTRKAICLGIARGLAYLHEESRLKIVHRDIKATNVLLDKDLNAKISDFGLAKLDEEENTHISTRIAGTIGYMAPEYAMRGYLTDKADVYSFGVVLLEIVSGKSNTKYRPKEDFVYLLDWAYVLHEQGNLLELVDPNLGSSYSEEEALSLLNLALLCTNPSPTLRPAMSSVVRMIDNQLSIQAPIVKGNIFGDESRLNSLNTISQDTQDCPSSSPFSNQVQSNIFTVERPSMSASIYVSAGQ